MRVLHLAIGKFNIDVIIKADLIPPTDASYYTDVFEILPGGAATNYAAAVVKLGHSAKLLAKVGKSDIALSLMKSLAELGVGLDYVEEVEMPPSAALIFLRDGGSISMIRRIGSFLALRKEDIMNYLGLFDVIHFASVPPNLVIKDPKAKLVSYDPGPYAGEISNVDVDVLFVNKKEYESIKDRIDAKYIVIKMGDKGARVITEGKECYAEAYRVEKVVDTTGAGDVFDAAFNYELIETNGDIKKALQFAVVSAGLKVKRLGGISSPYLNEVLEALHAYEPKVECY